jgi:hypothetical protein
VPRRAPIPLADLQSLARFRQMFFSPLGAWRYRTDTPYRHTFDFYQK